MTQEMYVSVGERQLWTRCDGIEHGRRVLFIAGANASGLMWPDEFIDQFSLAGFRAIRYDHRDTGKSTFSLFENAPYTVEDLAHDVIAVLDGWAAEKAHVLGLSLGTTIGQVLALDYPQRLASVTLMCGAALNVDFVGNMSRVFSGEPSPDGLPLPRKAVLEALAQRGRRNESLEVALEGRVHEWRILSGDKIPFNADQFWAWEQRAAEHAGSFDLPNNHALATPVALARGDELRDVTVPTLVIQGTEDPLNPPPHGRHIAELIPFCSIGRNRGARARSTWIFSSADCPDSYPSRRTMRCIHRAFTARLSVRDSNVVRFVPHGSGRAKRFWGLVIQAGMRLNPIVVLSPVQI